MKKIPARGICTEVVLDGVEHVIVVAPIVDPIVLSRTERAVAEAAALGESNAEIARARGVSPRTVANQLATIFRKLGIGSRAELVALLTANVAVDRRAKRRRAR